MDPAPVPVPASTLVPPSPPAPTTGFAFGVVAKPDGNDLALAKSVGAKVVRIEFAVSASASSLDQLVNGYAANGVQVQPLAGFEGIPSASDAANMREWALRHGPQGSGRIRYIEWGNENSFGYKAQANGYGGTSAYLAWAGNYARSAVAAATALQGTGVGLLVQLDDADGWPWVQGMKAAVPDLDKYVSGWTIHPYGPPGRDKLARMIEQARSAGWADSVRFYATEWGIATDDGRMLSDNYGFPRNLSYAQAATALRDEMAFYRSQPRVAQVLYYMSMDGASSGSSTDREDYFGLFTSSGADKAALTAEAKAQASG